VAAVAIIPDHGSMLVPVDITWDPTAAAAGISKADPFQPNAKGPPQIAASFIMSALSRRPAGPIDVGFQREGDKEVTARNVG
jgi:hypothetical protein